MILMAPRSPSVPFKIKSQQIHGLAEQRDCLRAADDGCNDILDL